MMTPSDQLTTPVLLLTFNRPDTTAQVLEAIRDARPEQLFVASDGPRADVATDADRVAQTRAVVERLVDWPCRIERRYSDTNQGCGVGVASSISWFFEHVEEGIILEDDTVPSASFFLFCDELLERYREDERVAMISGTNHSGYSPPDHSYTFARNRGCWGWASWSRAWQHMDHSMSWRARPDADRVIANMGVSGRHVRHWRRALQSIDAGRVDAWDWQWYFSMAAGSLVAIVPEVNLVSNVGFGNEATHTRGTAKPQFVRRYELRLPLKHPPTVQVDDAFDEAFEAFAMPSRSQRLLRRVQDKLRHVLLRLHGAVVPAPIDPFPESPEVFFRYGYAPIDQLKALENLRDLSEQLQIIGLKHWIFFGTLLGAVRENRLIPWDEDTDLAILEEELPLLLEPAALQRLEHAGFVLARWRNGLISFIRDGQYTDLYAFKKGFLRARTWGGFRVPAIHFADGIANVGHIWLPSPLYPERLLRRWYGRDWRVPIEKRPATPSTRRIRSGMMRAKWRSARGSNDTSK